MRISKIYSAVVGVSLSVAAVSVQACGFSPMAADRYNGATCGEAVKSVGSVASATIGNELGEGFKPFAANRYTAPVVATGQEARGLTVAAGAVGENGGFDPFTADRYSASVPSRVVIDSAETRVTRPSIEE